MTDIVKEIEAALSGKAPEGDLWPFVSKGLLNLAVDEIKKLRQELKDVRSECRDLEHSVNRLLND